MFSGVPKCNNSLKVAAVAAGFQTHMSIIIANKLYVFDLFMTKQFVLQRGVRNNIDTTTFFFFPFPFSPFTLNTETLVRAKKESVFVGIEA